LVPARTDAKFDLDHSYFMWVTKSEKTIQVKNIPAMFVVYPTAQRLSDTKLKESVNAVSDARALSRAVDYMELTTRDA